MQKTNFVYKDGYYVQTFILGGLPQPGDSFYIFKPSLNFDELIDNFLQAIIFDNFTKTFKEVINEFKVIDSSKIKFVK